MPESPNSGDYAFKSYRKSPKSYYLACDVKTDYTSSLGKLIRTNAYGSKLQKVRSLRIQKGALLSATAKAFNIL